MPSAAPEGPGDGRGASAGGDGGGTGGTGDGGGTAAAGRPQSVTTAAVVAVLQGAALAVWGLYMIVEGLVGDPDSPVQAEVGGLTVLGLAALPLLAARGLLALRRWGRGPVLIVQILALPVAWTMAQNGGGMTGAGAAIGASALVGVSALVHPATTSALEGRPQPSGP